VPAGGVAGRYREGVGDDRQLAVGQQARELARGGAGVEQDGPTRRDVLERGLRDAALLGGHEARTLAHGGLAAEPLDRDGAAVDAPEDATCLEVGQVAADGLGGDRQVRGDRRHLDAAVTARAVEDGLASLLGVHPRSSRRASRLHGPLSGVTLRPFLPGCNRSCGSLPVRARPARARAR
jgi:hypothetical protein